MVENTVSILKALGNPNKAKIVAHLAKHKGETAEDIANHLGYPLPTVYKYLRELEAARTIESQAQGSTRIYFAGNFNIQVSPKKLLEAFEEQNLQTLYESKTADQNLQRFRQIAQKVKRGKLTYGQAASTLGITYYEFVSLLEETGAINA